MLSTPLGRYWSILRLCGLGADSHRPGESCRLTHPGGGVRLKREITSGSHSGCPKESPYLPASSAIRATSGSLTLRSISESSRKTFSKPAGLITSIIRAGTSAAFHMACTSLRGLVMYPPAPRTTSRSPDRKPISPSVTMEYSSSRVCRCGRTRAPTGKGCSTMETAPPLSVPHSLKSTPMEPRVPEPPSPGCTIVSGGGSVVVTLTSRFRAHLRLLNPTLSLSVFGVNDWLGEKARGTTRGH